MLLPDHSPGLQLMQRLRDEAHRFAITFHRQRRDASARESMFDQLEGVGPVRRRALLRHFGSAERILAASPEELEGVPGVPAKTARRIYAQLHKATGTDGRTLTHDVATLREHSTSSRSTTNRAARWLDHAAGAARPVGHRRRDRQLPPAADPHPGDALIPAGDHLALAEREPERLAAVPRRVELVTGREGDADVVHVTLLPFVASSPSPVTRSSMPRSKGMSPSGFGICGRSSSTGSEPTRAVSGAVAGAEWTM